jgi:hypothetical protein
MGLTFLRYAAVLGIVARGEVGRDNVENRHAGHMLRSCFAYCGGKCLVDGEEAAMFILEPNRKGKVVEQCPLVAFASFHRIQMALHIVGQTLTFGAT